MLEAIPLRAATPACELAGVAFAGPRGIALVEAWVDDGAWQPAELHWPPLAPATWAQWLIHLPEPATKARIAVRATDGNGALQRQNEQPILPREAAGLRVVT